MKVPSIDVTDCLAVDSVYFVRVLLSFSSAGVGVGAEVAASAVRLDVVAGVAFRMVESAAEAVCSFTEAAFHTSLRTMFLK